MIGDRMDTDIVAGIETGLDTVLVLSGCTTRKDVENYCIPSCTLFWMVSAVFRRRRKEAI